MRMHHLDRLLVASIMLLFLSTGNSFAVCVDFDGDGVCDSEPKPGTFPGVPGPTVDCKATVEAYKLSHPNLICTCSTPTSKPSCKRNDSGDGGSGGISGGGSDGPLTEPITGRERVSFKDMSPAAKVAACTGIGVATGLVAYSLTPDRTTANIEDYAGVGAGGGLIIGAIMALNVTVEEFRPQMEHYELAAQFFNSIPLFAYSTHFNDHAFSALITISPGVQLYDIPAVIKRPEQRTGSDLSILLTYEW